MRRIAVIDTGSNTIRLVVYDVEVPRRAKCKSGSVSRSKDKTHSSLSAFSFGDHVNGRARRGTESVVLPKDCKFEQVVNMKKTAGLSNYVEPANERDEKKVCTRQFGRISNECSEPKFMFSDEGIDKASRVLAQLMQCAENLHCDKTYIFATAVLRNVSNSDQAVSDIEARIGKRIELLSGACEARLGFLGAFAGKQMTEGTTLIDLGGGSCEITRCASDIKLEGDINFSNMLQTTSLKIGCVSAYSRFVTRIFPDRVACEEIREATRCELETQCLDGAFEPRRGLDENTDLRTAYGIGGSIRAIAKIMREVNGVQKTPKTIYRNDILRILEQLHADPDLFAHTVVRAVPDRIHSVIPGSLIMLEVMERTGIDSISICKKGLREGYLLSKIAST